MSLSLDAIQLAERAFQEMPKLDTDTSSLVVIGLGSGALLDLILQKYGHSLCEENEKQRKTFYSLADCRPWMCIPIWVIEPDPQCVASVVQEMDWHKAIEAGQLRFFTGLSAFDDFDHALEDTMTLPPTEGVYSPDSTMTDDERMEATRRIQAAIEKRNQQRKYLGTLQRQQLEQWRAQHPNQHLSIRWRKKFARGNKLKILVIGTRFGFFAGHCAASVARGFSNQGHETTLLIESHDSHSVTRDRVQQAVYEIAPDLIFMINHPRYYHHLKDTCTDGIPYACWVQDPPLMEDLRRPEVIARQNELDFYFACTTEWAEELTALGYGETPVLQVPTDPSLFSMGVPADCNDPDWNLDCSYIATVPETVAAEIEGDRGGIQLDPLIKTIVNDAYRAIVDRLARGENLPVRADYQQIAINGIRRENPAFLNAYEANRQSIERLAADLEQRVERFAMRSQPIVWLVEAGHSVGIFGDGWQKHPILRSHFFGPIPYGRPMAAMLRGSSIHLCIHNYWTLTMKVLDCLATGTFPLVRWVDPIRDRMPITNWYREDRDIILFRTKDELLDKVRYYLDRPDERRRIAMRGREITLRHFTYDRLAETVLNRIRKRIASFS